MKRVGLRRELGLLEVTAYGVGIILGAGIYALIGIAAGMAGNSLWLSFLIAALLSAFTGLSYAELSSIYPKEAAESFYAKEVLRSDFIAFLIGWLAISSEIIGVAAVSLGFANYFHSLVKLPIILISISLILFLSFINFIGIKESSIFNLIFTSIEVLGLIIIISIGILYGNLASRNYFEIKNLYGMLSASALIFFAFIGFEDIVNVAEETKKARKIVPLALILSLLISSLLYIGVGISVLAFASPEELSASKAPLSLVASKVFGKNAGIFITFAALCSTLNTVLILLIVSSRMIWGMAEQGLLPKVLSKISLKRRTPYISIALVCIVSILFVFLEKISVVAEVSNFAILLVYASVNICLIFSRIRYPNIERKFKAPLNIGNLSLTPILGLAVIILLFAFLNPISISLGILVLLSGGIAYKILRS